MPGVPPSQGWIATTSAGSAVLDRAAADPAGVLLAADLDGTLAPIVENPDDAAVLPRARAALERLNGRAGTLAVITGRPVRRACEMLRTDRPGLGRIVILGQTSRAAGSRLPDAVASAVSATAPSSGRRWPTAMPTSPTPSPRAGCWRPPRGFARSGAEGFGALPISPCRATLLESLLALRR
ncbi:Trehalose_PPase multi-domain protein [Acidipropionibacterium acidipropionici ATCC 4875]|uniref:Trehalose_PPase multi-domain protein n=1 Tax=Acidipropionibacterium acidipropionici (strain ATCC 4875 / DSM 20272 / JCM 6432 / NBRC 12425 / NCIMB 8070 / 4) TaxID=1171373 RepID=K7RNR6_ACIA4|nr:trehalose-phosphatase [Acidipropionibacterium acidipropionici]AFV89649.1 Trehalose_PPase multi-domain protein [Acidipropionibacterium acidipropionici ATCC 4875]